MKHLNTYMVILVFVNLNIFLNEGKIVEEYQNVHQDVKVEQKV